MDTQTTPTLSTVERLLNEVEQYAGRLQKVRHKLGRLRRGSEAYLDLLPDLEVALDVLRSKAEHAHEALEEFEESLGEKE
jgi:flagellar biosynthesis chaperone FliJ